MLYLLKVWLEIKTNNIKLWNGNRKENKQISLAYCKHKYLLKVSKFQNEFRKSLFLLRYERKIVRIPALWCLTTQGRNPDNFSFIFWEKRWLRKFFLKFTDLYWSLSFPLWLKEENSVKRNISNSIPQPFCSFNAVPSELLETKQNRGQKSRYWHSSFSSGLNFYIFQNWGCGEQEL